MADDRGHPALGALVLAMASPGYLAATGILPADDSDFGVPRWALAWILVVCFGFVGLWMLGAGGGKQRWLACAGRVLAPLLASALAVHAAHHGLSRRGGVQLAWLLLGLLVAVVAIHHWRKLLGFRR